jgi:hypothetical protein
MRNATSIRSGTAPEGLLHAPRRGFGDGYGQHHHGCRLAKGTTTIYNAACEPYIQQLCHLLNHMGANISGIASNLLTIVGVEQLHGAEHHILPDMIEVGSFIGMEPW